MKKRVVSIISLICYLCMCMGAVSFASAELTVLGPSTLLKPMDTSYTAVKYSLTESDGSEKSGVVWSATDGLIITSDGNVILNSSSVNGTYTISAVYEGQIYTKDVTVKNGHFDDFSSSENGYASTANQNIPLPNGIKRILDDYTLEFDFNYPSSMDGYVVYFSTRNAGDWSVPVLMWPNESTYKLTMNNYANGVSLARESYITSKNYGEWSNFKLKSKFIPETDDEQAYALYDVYSDNNLAFTNIRPANSVASPYNGLLNFYIRQGGFCVDNLKIYSGDIINPNEAPYKYYGLTMSGETEFGVPRTQSAITAQYEIKNMFDAVLTGDAAWTVSPDNAGVSIDNSGLLTVTSGAENGDYTITATLGDKILTKTISVDSVEYVLTISGEDILKRKFGFSSQNLPLFAGDQFGTPAQAVTWSLKDDYNGVFIDETTGVVTVTSDARDGDYVICALASESENFDTTNAEFVLKVTSEEYKLVISGSENIYISDKDLPCSQSYSAKIVNVSDEADVYNISPQDMLCSLENSPQNVSFESGEFTINKGALEGVYNLNVSYGSYFSSMGVNVKKLTYAVDGPASLVAPHSGYRVVAYNVKANSGSVVSGVSWECSDAQILPDGRLLICADTPSEITISATYNNITYTKNVDVFVGDAPSGDVYQRSITYSGGAKMSVSSGVNTKYLTAEVIEDGTISNVFPVEWKLVKVSDGLNASQISVSGNILTVKSGTTGVVYIEGKIAGTNVSTGEVAIELVNAISSYSGSTLTVGGTAGDTVTISHYPPADGNYIDAVLGTSETPNVETAVISSDGTFVKQFDLSASGMHKIVVNNENSHSDEYIVKVNDNALFKQNNLAELLMYERANEYHIIYSGADKKLLDDAYSVYASLGADAQNKAAVLCNGTYDNYFSAVYMAQLADGNFDNTSALSAALKKAGYSDLWIELLLLDDNRALICENAFASKNDIQSIIACITEAVVLGGVENSSKSLPKEAKPYLAICGSEKYSSLAEGDKDKIASAVAGNSYASIADLHKAIDKVKLSDQSSSKPGSSQQGSVSGGSFSGGSSSGGSSSGGGYSPSVPQTPAEPEIKFADTDASHWAYSYINALSKKGIINGYEGNLFRPENNISRAEFVKILALAFSVPQYEGKSFTDVAEEAWYAPFVAGAKNAGLVMGDGECFNPDSFITRQEAATMIFRFAKYAGVNMTEGNADFTDKTMISDFAKDAVQSLCAMGIINGMPDGSFAPLELATRSQAAKMIYTVMEKGGIE